MTEGHIGLALSFNSRHGGSPSYFDALALKSGHKEMHCPYLVGGVLGCFRGQPRGSLRSLGCLWIPTDFSVAFWLHLAANTHKPMRILVTPWNSNNEIAVEMALMKGVHKLFVCVTKLCERECVCVTKLCVKDLWVTKLCVTKVCVWKNGVCVWQSYVWKNVCVCDKVVCERCVCVITLCVTTLCVRDCVWQNCVTKLCVTKTMRGGGWGGGGGGGTGFRTKNENPTQRCGEKNPRSTNVLGLFPLHSWGV